MRHALPRTFPAIALLATAMSMLSTAGLAQSVTAPPIFGSSTQRTSPLVDPRIQESIDRREAFQQLQQIQRQQDRDALRYRPERFDVPVIKPSCTSSVHGSSLSSGCR